MKREFVRFVFTGTFSSEDSLVPIDRWDAAEAVKMAKALSRPPFAFNFITRTREDDELDSKQTAESEMHYLGGTVETLDEILQRNAPNEEILRGNMKTNGYSRVIHIQGRTFPLGDDAVLLEALKCPPQ